MKRTHVLPLVALASVLGGAAVTHAALTPSARASSSAKVELRSTRLGKILTTASGLTLYEFTHDRGSENSCVKIHNCAKFWPALETTGRPSAGAGVNASLLSSIGLPGGARQVTYAGHALYLFSQDRPGETGYVGESAFGGRWYALNAAGRAVK